MGMIGRWIDEKCRTEPEVMRRVYRRKFGNLATYFGQDNECGCLVGTWALESGVTAAELLCSPDADVGGRVLGVVLALLPRANVLAPGQFRAIEARVVRILKQRIRKSLGIAPENRPVQQSEHAGVV